jgi:hypothetical protein
VASTYNMGKERGQNNTLVHFNHSDPALQSWRNHRRLEPDRGPIVPFLPSGRMPYSSRHTCSCTSLSVHRSRHTNELV